MMNKPDEIFDTIFDACLGRVIAGEGIDAVLADYPEDAAGLRPLLETVIQARGAADIKPRPEFKRQAFYDYQAAVRDLPQKGTGGFSVLRQWWVSALAALAVVLLGGGVTGLAAQDALPDSGLYAVKLATENARIAFTFSDEGKAGLYAQYADERLDEILTMAAAGNADGVIKATENLDRQLIAMADAVAPQPESDGLFSFFGMGSSEESMTTAGTTTTATTTAMATTTTTATETMTAEPSTTIAAAEPAPTVTPSVTVPSTVTPTIVMPTTEAVTESAQRDVLGTADDDEVMKFQVANEEYAADANSGDADELELEVLEQAIAANERILAMLDDVSNDVREALLEALAVLNQRYQEVISNMR